MRYPDLLQGYCGGKLDACNWASLRGHLQSAGAKEGRIITCYSSDLRCYIRRYPDLAQAFCTSSNTTDCNWHDLLLHWYGSGSAECVDPRSYQRSVFA